MEEQESNKKILTKQKVHKRESLCEKESRRKRDLRKRHMRLGKYARQKHGKWESARMRMEKQARESRKVQEIKMGNEQERKTGESKTEREITRQGEGI